MSDDDTKRICAHCIGEAYLRAEVERDGETAKCDYCAGEEPSITIEELADRIQSAFEEHYVRTYDQPHAWQQSLLGDRESDYEWERDGDAVIWAIAEAADIGEDPATDVHAILEERHSDFEIVTMGEECEFDADSHYERKGPNDVEWRVEWRAFERSIKTETRLLGPAARDLLSSVFSGVDCHRTHDGRPIVREAGPGLPLACVYRARAFHSDGQIEEALKRPDREVGSPPTRAAAAGRMNALGISVFYGALDPAVALAEVRPPVGSRVAVARFEIIRPIRLLDLEALRSVFVEGSIFDSAYMRRLELATFLERLSERMTMPVMPGDEPHDYLVTQAIADYLATEMEPPLDGILFPSVQQGEGLINIVLFHKAARVDELDIPNGTEIVANLTETTDEGVEPDYWVVEEIPKPVEEEEDDEALGIWLDIPDPDLTADYDSREAALRIDTASLQIHHVRRVDFMTSPHPVQRHRWEKRERGI